MDENLNENYLNKSKKSKVEFDHDPISTNANIRDLNKTARALLPKLIEIKQIASIIISGTLFWGSLWFIFKDAVVPGQNIFNVCVMVIAGYAFGHTLERLTGINAVVGMVLTGVICKHCGSVNYLQDPLIDLIDFHLRQIYPVIILTKGALGWNWRYIKNNLVKVSSLATLPWMAECLSTATFANILMDYPFYWGLHLGAILASVSPAVVVPTVSKFHEKGLGSKNQICLLVANAGGLDTAFTEGMFGVINTFIFRSSPIAYKIFKAIFAILLGSLLGLSMGMMADWLPAHADPYSSLMKSLFIFTGGLFLNYCSSFLAWGGVSGVAIMVCAGSASTRWVDRGWAINANPVTDNFKLLWLVFEPMLFTLTGFYLNLHTISWSELGTATTCVLLALACRLFAAFCVTISNNYSIRESLFITITWIPKAIVEAVLVRVASDSLRFKENASDLDKAIAQQHSDIIVIAILLTTTIGSLLAKYLGPVLLSEDSRVAPASSSKQTK